MKFNMKCMKFMRFMKLFHFISLKKMPLFLGLLTSLASASAFADLNIQEFTTRKNIHVIYVEDKNTDLTTVAFAFKGKGAATDPTGKEGLSALMLHLLMERSKDGDGLDKHAIDKQLKSLGVLSGIKYSLDADNILFQLKSPSEKLKESFGILKTIFADQKFDAKELNKMQSYDPPEARLATSAERAFASKILINQIFQGHQYANPAYGTLDGRQSITIADVTTAAKQKLTRDTLVFAIIGNLPAKTVIALIDNAFGNLPEKSDLQHIAEPILQAKGQVTVIPKSSPQSGVMFGQKGLSPKDPDYLPYLVLNDILGGKPFTSRLWQEVRENRGLVYEIATDPVPFETTALLMGGFESDNNKVKEVIDTIRNEWKLVQSKGVTEDEFKASKTGLLGGFVLNFTSAEGIVSYLLNSYLSGMPADYINKRNALLQKVTLQDVNRVAKKLLNNDQLTFVVVGEPSAIGAAQVPASAPAPETATTDSLQATKSLLQEEEKVPASTVTTQKADSSN